MAREDGPSDGRGAWLLWVRGVLGTLAVAAGGAFALLVTAIGHCSAFGGRCPAEPEPLLEDDVFGMVAVTVTIVTLVVGQCLRPGRRAAVIGLATAIPLGVVSGLAAATYARG